MNETTKTKRLMSELEVSVLRGRGIDIGCGPDPIRPDAVPFDLAQGDAADIQSYVQDEFDYVYSSHCLEHMPDPRKVVLDWWKLVCPGGHLFLVVPDEDLYEQGVFPSRFNSDHKATFTLSKAKSWSPVSVNMLELAQSLPGGKLKFLALQDHGYDWGLLRHGTPKRSPAVERILKLYRRWCRLTRIKLKAFEALKAEDSVVDQSLREDVVAQIHCIVQKEA